MGDRKPLRETIPDAVIKVLKGRGGFDGWWDDIDSSIQEEIRNEMADSIAGAIQNWSIADSVLGNKEGLK